MASERTSTARYLVRTLILGVVLGLIMFATHLVLAIYQAN